MTKFFVSYSRSVKDEVGKVVDLLVASGHDVWWDGDIPFMKDWWATILENIEACEVFIFVASEKSIQSAYCIAELKYANERNRPILPFIMDDDARYKLPEELPHRNQWLIYDDNPAHMLKAINDACKHIEWMKHRDIRAPRPPEPSTGGKSLGRQFQEALRLAHRVEFDESKRLLRNIRELDYGEWGQDCDGWLARLNSYAPIMDLVDDEHTIEHAQQSWNKHIRMYGNSFDPHEIESKLNTAKRPRRWASGLAILGAVFIGIVLTIFTVFINKLSVSETATPSVTDIALGATDIPTDDSIQSSQTDATVSAQQMTTQLSLSAEVQLTVMETPTVLPTSAPTNTATATNVPTLTVINTSTPRATSTAMISAPNTELPVTDENLILPHEVAQTWTAGQCVVINAQTYARRGPGVDNQYVQDGLNPSGGLVFSIVEGPELGRVCGSTSECDVRQQGYWWRIRNDAYQSSGYGDPLWVWQRRLSACS